MRFSGTFSPNSGRPEFELFIDSVVAAERAGFSRAWVFDSQMMWGDLYVYLSHGLAQTEHLVMGAGVTNPVTRHITVTANAHVTLNQIYPGRVMLGLGRGNTSCRSIGVKPMSLRDYEQALRDVQALMAGESVAMNGIDVKVAFAAEQIKTVVPAFGPKVLRLAGALADVVHLDIGAHPEAVKWAIDFVHEGADAAGRDRSEVEIGLWAPIYVSDDQQAAWDFARAYPEDSLRDRCAALARANPDLELPDPIMRLLGADTETVAQVGAAKGDGSMDRWREDYRGGADVHRLSDQLVDEHVIAGPADKCLARLRALHDVGVDEVCAFILNGEFEQMERIGSELMPTASTW